MILQAKNLHKVYNGVKKAVNVLKGVDLVIKEGNFISLVGPSGAGKSTLLHILGGLDVPTKGKVIFEGKDIYKLKERELCSFRNERMGFIFQFYHLLSEFTVLENVIMPALISRKYKISPGAIKETALRLLKQVGLEERRAHFPSQLSGGEQQRAAIVRALINEPAVLLCDEPTGNLDSAASVEIISLIRKINEEKKMTVVLVTHNQELAKTADTTYSLKDGILVN